MMQDLVSVIIPVYNREKTINKAIHSVLEQDYKNIEIIIVDDCSIDNTVSVVQNAFSEDERVILIKLNKNSGACIARNRGIEVSKGDYIAFLDSDDTFYANKISLQIEALRNSKKDLCASDYDRISADGTKCRIMVSQYDGVELYKDLLFCNYITTGTLIGKRKCFSDINFDASLPRYQDWDLVLRLSQKYSFCLLNIPTLLQEEQSNSITTSTSHKKTLDALKIIYSKNEKELQHNKKARTQMKWLIGVHSMYTNTPMPRMLWDGATNILNIKRIIIAIIYMTGFGKHFLNI